MSTTIQGDPKAASQRQPTLALSSFETGKLKLAVISLSIANLCFLLTWKQVLGLAEDPVMRYFQERPPHPGLLLALIVDVCILALIVFAFGLLGRAASKAGHRLGIAGLAFFCLLAFYQVQRFFTDSLQEWKPEQSFQIPKLILASILALLIFRFPRRALQSVITLLLIASPLFFMLALNGLWAYETVDLHRARDGTPAPMLPNTQQRPHFVWIIFDELDARLMFEVRPSRIQLPEFDRLRAESIYGTRTRTPSTDTLWAMPSFILGRRVAQVKLSTNHLGVQFTMDGPVFDAASLPNVFRSARESGLNTGLTGWFHPYCRIFSNDLTDCKWMSFGGPVVRVEKYLRDRSFFENALYVVNWQARYSVPSVIKPLRWAYPEPQEPRIWREQQISGMRFTVSNSMRMLQNPDLNLVFLHIATPHPAGIWDTRAKRFTLENSNYIDNLALADKTLGDFRRLMEQLGYWDRTTILISGDHPYRTGMWMDSSIWTAEMARLTGSVHHPYVPFFLKLPSQHSGVEYTTEFSNVLSADLALEILKGQLKTPAEVVSWLNAHASASLN